jgi:hypothetical protein
MGDICEKFVESGLKEIDSHNVKATVDGFVPEDFYLQLACQRYVGEAH